MSVIVIGDFEAKAKLSELLDRVSRGEEVIITRHGKPVARLVSGHGEKARGEGSASLLKRARALRKGMRLDGLSWKELRDQGRR